MIEAVGFFSFFFFPFSLTQLLSFGDDMGCVGKEGDRKQMDI